jgi:hypothetical protein
MSGSSKWYEGKYNKVREIERVKMGVFLSYLRI